MLGNLGDFNDPIGDQAGRKVVHQIARQRENNAGRPRRKRRRLADKIMKQTGQHGGNSAPVQSLDQHEQARNQRQGCPMRYCRSA